MSAGEHRFAVLVLDVVLVDDATEVLVVALRLDDLSVGSLIALSAVVAAALVRPTRSLSF